MAIRQKSLSNEQIAAFFHDDFVDDQARDFVELARTYDVPAGPVTDVGGGCGHFARRLSDLTGRLVRVIDADPTSVQACVSRGVEAVVGDALQPSAFGDEKVVAFNLILHHLVGEVEADTRALQRQAIAAWRGRVSHVFINEYIYESYAGAFSGRLIYTITKSSVLSWFARIVSRLLPSLQANTFGVGVRFRAHTEWTMLFESAGFSVAAVKLGIQEPVSLPRRLLLIRQIRRDSFLLVPRA